MKKLFVVVVLAITLFLTSYSLFGKHERIIGGRLIYPYPGGYPICYCDSHIILCDCDCDSW